MKLMDIYSKKVDVVGKRKIWFLIPAGLVALAIIFGVIYGFVFKGNVFNLGMDFTGGYAITIKFGDTLEGET